jgi:hypothetical protein
MLFIDIEAQLNNLYQLMNICFSLSLVGTNHLVARHQISYKT